MGRRSAHTGEELRDLILEAAEQLIEAGGLAGLSAREIAKKIGYSPGTIYNVFENLDDLILHVEARMLDALSQRLAKTIPESDPSRNLLEIAQTYLHFTHQNPKLWNLLFEHHLPAGVEAPGWYKEKLEALMTRVEAEVARLISNPDNDAVKRAARVLWAGVHGITSLSTADKLSNVTTETAGLLIEDLVKTFLAGLTKQQLAQCA